MNLNLYQKNAVLIKQKIVCVEFVMLRNLINFIEFKIIGLIIIFYEFKFFNLFIFSRFIGGSYGKSSEKAMLEEI